MNAPYQQGDDFLADVRRVLSAGGHHLWWLGQSGFLWVQNGRAVVFDPYLSDSLTRKYAGTYQPHVRITGPVIEPERLASLGVIDLISSSHQHTDHFDGESLQPLLAANPKSRFVLPAASRDLALERLGPETQSRWTEMDAGLSVRCGEVEVHGIASAHNTIEFDAAGRCKYLGYVLRWRGYSIYHSGDTLWHKDLESILRPFAVNLALLPINGNKPERRVAGNLNGIEAARLAFAIGAGRVIPCHYDMFAFNTASPEYFEAECARLGQNYTTLQNGEGTEL